MAVEPATGQSAPTEPQHEDDFPLLELVLRNYLANDEITRIRKAYFFACMAHQDQPRASGDPFITHPIAVAEILAEYQWDADTIIAGLLHDVLEDTGHSYQELEAEFGKNVADLVKGVTKVGRMAYAFDGEAEVDNVRRMLVATAQDLRVIVIKLADRLHNMRTLEHLSSEQQQRIAQNTLDIFAPIAHRLGLGQIKWEMEDLSLSYLQTEMYQAIKKKVSLKRREREQYIQQTCGELKAALADKNIHCTVEGRAKHFYSIYQKMSCEKKTFEEIYDLIALRVVTESISECYGILGEVHTMWRQVEGRFKDYISNPKPNNYRSIHTTVLGPHGRMVEIQIRTLEMHLDAEYGIAAHWRYKEEKNSRIRKDAKWLEQFAKNLPDTYDPDEFLQSIRNDLFTDEVYVYTPKNEIVRLPKDATPIDLAYKIHTQLGNQCCGAKVNGRLVPLNYALQTGDVVSVMKNPNSNPSHAWLQIVKTSSARNKIRRYLLDSRRDELMQMGQSNLSRELQRAGYNHLEFYNSALAKDIIESLSVKNLDDLFVNIGFGRVSTKQILARLLKSKTKPQQHGTPTAKQSRAAKQQESKGSVVRLGDIDDILYRRAMCCNPLPGDEIIGFVTRGRGVTIHRAQCKNVSVIKRDPQRILHLFWEGGQEAVVSVTIEIKARDRKNLLVDISQTISSTGTNIVGSISKTESGVATFIISVDVKNTAHLEVIMHQLFGVEGVKSVRKVRNPHQPHKSKQPH